MVAGRRRRVDPVELHRYAQTLYWDFRQLIEGENRLVYDKQRHQELRAEGETLARIIRPEDKSRHESIVEKEIRTGCIGLAQRSSRLQQLEAEEIDRQRRFYEWAARDEADKEVKVKGDPDVLEDLLNAKTAERVRKICRDAYATRKEHETGSKRIVLNWSLPVGSSLPWYLSRYAEQFVAAKRDPRFPGSRRPTTPLKQLWFLSRALAGAHFGEKPRTAINLVGSMRPEELFEESGAAKPRRNRKKVKKRL
jgi:hypothetical protein